MHLSVFSLFSNVALKHTHRLKFSSTAAPSCLVFLLLSQKCTFTGLLSIAMEMVTFQLHYRNKQQELMGQKRDSRRLNNDYLLCSANLKKGGRGSPPVTLCDKVVAEFCRQLTADW